MIRKTLLAISLLLLAGTLGLWVRRYWADDELLVVNTSRVRLIRSARGDIVFGLVETKSSVTDTERSTQVVFGVTFPNLSSVDPVGQTAYWSLDASLDDLTGNRLGLIRYAQRVTPWWKRLAWYRLPIGLLVAAFAVYPMVACLRGPWRQFHRRRHNLCLACGYDLTGNVSGRCSECGVEIASKA